MKLLIPALLLCLVAGGAAFGASALRTPKPEGAVKSEPCAKSACNAEIGFSAFGAGEAAACPMAAAKAACAEEKAACASETPACEAEEACEDKPMDKCCKGKMETCEPKTAPTEKP